MSRAVRTYLDYRDMRRDRRYEAPPVKVTIADTDYRTLNWSLGGCLIEGGPMLAPGMQLNGTLQLDGRTENYPITAEAVRRDRERKTLAFRFIAPAPALIDALDRAAARRLGGQRP